MEKTKWTKYSEGFSSKSKSYYKFYNGMGTKEFTIYTYAYNMNRFMNYLVEKKKLNNNEEYDELTNWDTDKITDALQDYVFSLNKKIRGTSISSMLAASELFFEMNRKIWYRKLVRKSIKKDDLIQGGKTPATDMDVLNIINTTTHPRELAILHFLFSTGIRPMAVADPVLRIKHLVDMSNDCKAIRVYDESKDGYWAFLTPEASKSLETYIQWRKFNHEIITPESPVFTSFSKHAKGNHLKDSMVRYIVSKTIKKAGIVRTKTGNRYDKAIIYMFRKRFNGKLKMNNTINSNIAEKLMAHNRGLDGTYLQPTREECFAEFIKAIPSLTVDPTERQNLKILEQEQKISELEKKDKKIIEQEKTFTEYKKEQDEKMDKVQAEIKRLVNSIKNLTMMH